jgi:hypothetical protein
MRKEDQLRFSETLPILRIRLADDAYGHHRLRERSAGDSPKGSDPRPPGRKMIA